MTEDLKKDLGELLKEVRSIEVQSKRLVSSVMAGEYKSVFRGSGIEFDEVREYADGDDPRSVDWNVTARMGRPYIKTYVDERELTVLFLLDLSPSMSNGFGAWSGRQTAARVCACLGLSAIINNDKVGLIAFSQGVDKYAPPKKGTGHVLQIIRDCLMLSGRDPDTNITTALETASRVAPRGAVLFLISDFFCEGWEEALTLCARGHDLIAVRLLYPELTPPQEGLMRMRDPESGRKFLMDWNSKSTRNRYKARVMEWRADVEKKLMRARVDLMDIPIPVTIQQDSISRPMLKFFRMREQRGARQ